MMWEGNQHHQTKGKALTSLKRRGLVAGAALLVLTVATFGLTSCDPAVPTAGPNKVCPAGWYRVSTQGWWGDDTPFGTAKVPQVNPPETGEGGHLHVEFCFPFNKRVNGDSITINGQVKTHKDFTGQGDRLDVGDGFNNGTSIASIPLTWNSECASPNMCSTNFSITVPLTNINHDFGGLGLLRVRYLNADHPSGDRQFASNEVPFWHNVDPSTSNPCPKAIEGKGWYNAEATGGTDIEYARAGFNGCFPTGPISGNFTFNMRSTSTNLPISLAEAHIDARYGVDDFSGLIPGSQWQPPNVGGSNNRSVTLNTTNYADGWHCLSVLTEVPDSNGVGVVTGVQEIGILIDNPGGPADASKVDAGHGSCYDTMPAM
jgi:hypothetical protein